MKKVKFLLVLVMTMVFSVAMAQKTVVKGVLMDKNLGEGEPFATVRIFKQGETTRPVSMFLTDKDGNFSREVNGKGKFNIIFSSVGKEDLSKSIELSGNGTLNLDTIYIKENVNELSDVAIVAQKPLVKMEVDKMSYSVAEDEDAKSSTVLDMLRKVPMVTVDGQNIEVVTNPGARYDAEGASGVLNIVMNRMDTKAMESMNGYNGTIRVSAGNRSIGGGAFVSGQQGKFSYSGNLMENYSTPGTTDVEMEQKNGDGSILTSAATKVKIPFTMGNVSLGYELDDMSSVNATFSLTSFNMKNDGHTTTSQTGGLYGNGFNYVNDMKMRNKKTSFSGNVDYQRFFNKERTKSFVLTYQLDYSPSKMEQNNRFSNTEMAVIDLTNRNSVNKEHTTDHTIQADFTTPLGQNNKLSLGSKLMMRRADSDAKYYLADVYDERSSMDYLYKNTILAGYSEYTGQWDKLGAKAGLRYEQTWQNVEYRLGQGQNFSTSYGSLVPSASLSYTLAPTSNIGLTYNMRISRPGISYLNPYVNRADPNSLSYGNTDLDVEKSHNISLVYNLYSTKLMLNVNVHHNFTDNAIEQYSFFDGTLLNTTYGNIVKRHQTGVNVYANWLLAPKTRIMLNGGLNYNDMRSSVLDLKNSGWQGNMMAGLQQTMPWDLKLGAYLITSTKSYTLQGWSSGFNILTANLSKSFFNDKLSVSIQGMLGLSDGGNLKMETYSQGKNFLSHQTIKVPMSGFNVSVSYTFGNTKQKAKQHVSRVQNDYIEQQSQGEMLNNVGNVGQ